jgi:hypothetical protein
MRYWQQKRIPLRYANNAHSAAWDNPLKLEYLVESLFSLSFLSDDSFPREKIGVVVRSGFISDHKFETAKAKLSDAVFHKGT